jgi:hypothetical protein
MRLLSEANRVIDVEESTCRFRLVTYTMALSHQHDRCRVGDLSEPDFPGGKANSSDDLVRRKR